ncbi:MAG: DNA gyrase, A subunit, partial [Thermodesulfobacterium commune]
GIRLDANDEVLGLIKTSPRGYLFTITEKGFGKKTPFSDFRLQGRGGKGIIAHGLNEKTGYLADGVATFEKEDFVVFSSSGKAIRISSQDVPQQGRATKGVRIITLLPGEIVMGITPIRIEEKT